MYGRQNTNETEMETTEAIRHQIETPTHDNLTVPAHERLMELLRYYGNNPIDEQDVALRGLLKAFTDMARFQRNRSYAFPLPTGAGKTLAIICWAAQIYKSGITGISVAICASKVEELCHIKRQIIAEGVPDDFIGLLHSYQYNEDRAREYLENCERLPEGYASLPCTENHQQKQVLLATHNRVRGDAGPDQYSIYKDRQRDLFIWDESLFISEPYVFSKTQLEQAIGWFEPLEKEKYGVGFYSELLRECISIVDQEIDNQLIDRMPSKVRFPDLDEEAIAEIKSNIGNRRETDTLRRFLDIAQNEFRVIINNSEGHALVTYEVKVPEELDKVIVLDASYNIRHLSQANAIHIGREYREEYKPHAFKVSYENVMIHQLPHGGGRATVESIQSKKNRKDRLISREIAEVVKSIPEDQGIIIFTFKQRTPDGLNHVEVLERDLQGLGIDTTATINVNGEQKPRFVWLTWGQETAVSHFSYCQNVIFAGVLHRAYSDLAGTVIGEKDDLTLELDREDLWDLRESEVGHCLYQAISRSACRIIINGVAKKTDIWLIHGRDIKKTLGPVLPNAKLKRWQSKYLLIENRECTKENQIAHEIAGFLSSYEEGDRISVQKLKKRLGMTGVPKRTFSRALETALIVYILHWRKEKQSLVRTTPDDYFPSTETEVD